MGIESIGGQYQPQQIPQGGEQPLAGDVGLKEKVSEVAPLFGNAGSNLSVRTTRATDKTNITHETTDAPELDEAVQELLEGINVDLEALIAYLQADSDEAQLMAAKERIESLQGQLDAAHQDSMNKVNESIEAMKEQEKNAELSKVLGWLSVAIAVVMAVVSVLTCGGAAAVCAVIGAALAVTMQVLNETGAMEDIVKAFADFIQECAVALAGDNISQAEAEAIAQIVIAVLEAVITLALTGGAGFAKSATGVIKNVSEAAMKAIKIASTAISATMQVASLASNIVSGIANYDASMAQADVTEMQAILKKLQTMLDQENEEMQELLKQLMDSLAAVTDLLASKQDALKEISMNIGA